MPRRTAGRTPLCVSFDQFGWDWHRLATLEHSTFPWFETTECETSLDALPLQEASRLGMRERLSLVGQFAAHCAFLRFNAISPGEFDPAEWSFVRARGSDPRLVRLHARSGNGVAEIPPVSLIENFGALLKVQSLEVFRQSWAKAEAVYQEIERRLAADVRAGRQWFRRSAVGFVDSPGTEGLTALLSTGRKFLYADDSIVRSLARAAALQPGGPPVIVLRGVSPVDRHSGVRALVDGTEIVREDDFAESVLELQPRAVGVVVDPQLFDEPSRRIVQTLLRISAPWSWLVPASVRSWLAPSEDVEDAPPPRLFVISSRVAAAEELTQELSSSPFRERSDWFNNFVAGDEFSEFLERGTIPATVAAGVDWLREPRRSFVGALAILGQTVSLPFAQRFLEEIGCRIPLSELLEDGRIATVEAGEIAFRNESVRRRCMELLSRDARRSLAVIAARRMEESDRLAAARLYAAAEEPEKAATLLEQLNAKGTEAAVLAEFPETIICGSPVLASRYAAWLIDAGRYLDARRFAEVAQPELRNLLLARAERRLGNYSAALENLDGLTSFDARLLRGELLRLQGLYAEAQRELETATPEHAGDVARLEYELAILSRDRGGAVPMLSALGEDPYLAGRWETYRAITEGEYRRAREKAADAERLARTLPHRIDASLDLMYADFLRGEWEQARHVARSTLALVEETQGDRAAGGVLFTLAYLCADSAHWEEAEHTLQRLNSFYRGTGDERRMGELRMLEAHLAFCRGHWNEAKRRLASGADPRWSAEIREAANLILDEIDWMNGELRLVRTSGASACVALTHRHQLNRARASGILSDALDPFSRALAEFEMTILSGGTSPPPGTSTRSEMLRLYRSCTGLLRRAAHEFLEAKANEIATELRIDSRRTDHEEGLFTCELQLLQLLSAARFPFGPTDLGDFRWRFASRNRLGQWTQTGSLPPLEESELMRIEEQPAPDWTSCGEGAWLYIEGFDQFATRSREAARSLFALQVEHFRTRRVVEQEQMSVADRSDQGTAGIFGESAAIREILGSLDRVARRDVAVCILGESGTGKELFARAVHLRSPRKSKPFTAINCAALPETLVESELFGHVRGAFTGADRDRPGLLESSDGGTVFLDEIGELPLPAQAKLLRFLQEGEFRRVGETTLRRSDVRIIAATNRKLDQAVDRGSFREDLYYRIRGIDLVIPPLRERGSDILLLARHFLAREQEKHRGGPCCFSEDVEAVFLSYPWPGNVRELQNAVRAGHALAGDSRTLEVDHLPERLQAILVVRGPKGSFHDELVRFRRGLIEKSLLESGGNQNKAAKALGMTRQALAYQIRELGLMVKR